MTMTTIEPATPSPDWSGKTADEIKAEIGELLESIMNRAQVEAPRLQLAKRLGFMLGEDWAFTRMALVGLRDHDPDAFLRWNRADRCYCVLWREVPPGAIQDLNIEGSVRA